MDLLAGRVAFLPQACIPLDTMLLCPLPCQKCAFFLEASRRPNGRGAGGCCKNVTVPGGERGGERLENPSHRTLTG